MKLFLTIILTFLYLPQVFSQTSEKFTRHDLNEIKKSIFDKDPLSLPFQNEDFIYFRSNLFSDSSRNSTIQTYDIKGVKNVSSGKMVISKNRIFYTLLTRKGLEIYTSDLNNQKIYRHQEKDNEGILKCNSRELKKRSDSKFRNELGRFSNGSVLNTFRLAIVTTGEFYDEAGSSEETAKAIILESISSVNLIFERELSTTFVLDDRVHIFRDKTSDPFTPPSLPNTLPRTIQSSAAFAEVFEFDSYDVGMTLNVFEPGWYGGGEAIFEIVCSEISHDLGPYKAATFSTSYGFSPSVNPFNFISTICHELGHAFSARHTFNGNKGACTPNSISENASYEIGGGVTIMSYPRACGDDSYADNYSDLQQGFYFHSYSLFEMKSFIDQLSCQTRTEQSNNLPILDLNPCQVNSFDIPLNTRFSISADAQDIDSDSLLYIWEQFDEDGPGSPTAGNNGSVAAMSNIGPLMRNYYLTDNPRRTIPQDILKNGIYDAFEGLPLVPRELNFRCTVRDYNQRSGAFISDQIKINVLNIPQFKVNVSGTEDNIFGGEVIEISWNDDGISALCDEVDVDILSIDYPDNNFIYSIAKDLDFQSLKTTFEFPPIFEEGTYVIRVKCSDNECLYFFQVSAEFEAYDRCLEIEDDRFFCGNGDVIASAGDESLNLNINALQGFKYFTTPEFFIGSGSEMHPFIQNDLNNQCSFYTKSDGTPALLPYKLMSFTVEEEGNYSFRYVDNLASIVIFDQEVFEEVKDTPELICNAVLAVSTQQSNENQSSTLFYLNATASLLPCKNYLLGVSHWSQRNYKAGPNGGAGLVHLEDYMDTLSQQFGLLNDKEVLVFLKNDSDFRDVPPGKYSVIPISSEDSIEQLNDLLGLTVDEIRNEGYCVYIEDKISSLEILAIDNDDDGFNSSEDCDDSNANINPDAEEIANNDIDENCDGIILTIDADGDGFNSDNDCDDSNADINPEAEEIANNDIDENCDGEALIIDEDGDGFNSDDDCDDSNIAINPNAIEIANNGIDENCDGEDLISSSQEMSLSGFKVFPNPFSTLLNVESNFSSIEIQVFNILGLKVYASKNIYALHQIETFDWMKGIYIVKVKEKDHQKETVFKIFKN